MEAAPLVPALLRAAASLAELSTALPQGGLTSEERMVLSAHLLPCGPVLVEQVAQALSRPTVDLSDLGLTAAALRARQAEADGWLLLKNHLKALLQRASDQHLAAQSDVNQCALRVLERVEGEAALEGPRPRPGSATSARAQALLGARLVLRHYRKELAPAKKQAPRPTARTRRYLDAGLQRLFSGHLAREGARLGRTSPPRPGGAAPPAAATPATPAAPAAPAAPPPAAAPAAPASHPGSPSPAPTFSAFSPQGPGSAPARAENQAMTPATLYSEFLQQALGQAPPPPPQSERAALSTDALVSLVTDAAAAQARSQAPPFTASERERLAGKRPTLLPELLVQCGLCLSQEPAFAGEISVPPAIVDKTARQDAALSRLIKASGDAFTAAEEAEAQTADAADAAAEAALDGAERRAAAQPGERAFIEVAFAEARRLYADEKARAGKQKDKLARKLAPGRAALGKLQQESAELRLLHGQLDTDKGDSDV